MTQWPNSDEQWTFDLIIVIVVIGIDYWLLLLVIIGGVAQWTIGDPIIIDWPIIIEWPSDWLTHCDPLLLLLDWPRPQLTQLVIEWLLVG